ncbi:alpha/beta hydrolase [Nocardioides sp.]|uniref:alpha/beta hydrolase n=1 Tax=Nocardioides sp. TaxID=35761 RepID=UPI003D135EFB
MGRSPQTLDPEVGAFLATLPASPALSRESLPGIRAARAAAPLPALSDRVVRTTATVPGDPPVTLRISRPRVGPEPLACIYSIHGGGFVNGSARSDDLRFDDWCQRLECVGVSVEYRLAPETAYPGPLEDCYAGIEWLFAHASELGIDPTRVGLLGVSAGGGLAAGTALRLRDRAGARPAFLMLQAPMLDDRQVTESSQWDDVPVWGPESNAFGWQAYLGDAYGTAWVSPYAAPSRATDLSGLPATYVAVGSLDGFHDEDVEFAQRLVRAGVSTDLHVYAGAPHAFDLPGCEASVAVRARRDALEWLAGRLGQPAK